MTIGILGGGQLGRMLALAGIPLGFRFRFLDPALDAPARDVGELLVSEFTDAARSPTLLDRFADGLGAITYEFENVPVELVERLVERAPVAPPVTALRTGQDREAEKSLFASLGIPVPEYAIVRADADLDLAANRLGLPCVMKTLRLGYDGKGQAVVRSGTNAKHISGSATDSISRPGSSAQSTMLLARAWDSLGRVPVIVERLVPFTREVSIVCCRGRDGCTEFYPLAENAHRHGILRVSRAPVSDPGGSLTDQARAHAQRVLETLGYVGVLGIEFFVERRGREDVLLANELAPRVHNSAHWSIEGAVTSQFENHVRAVAGLPLGSAESTGPCAMVNLIGGSPPRHEVISIPGASLHWYGKDPRPGRKIGHVTVRARTDAELDDRLRAVVSLVDRYAEG